MDYIKKIRTKVGTEKIILLFSGAIIYNKTSILLQKRADCDKWGLPGGFMELGESTQECCVRELMEETGITVDQKNLELHGVYSKYEDYYNSGDIAQPVGIIYKSYYDGELSAFANEETVEIAFFDYNNLPKMFNQQNQDILDDFIANSNGIYNR
jgi:ADP-ribose pyrophosphatase YjhB (NUDIX family)